MALDTNNELINGNGGIVVNGAAVRGGYFVTESTDITSTGEAGKIPDYACVTGALCYCTGTTSTPINKFYQYNGTSWVESSIMNQNAFSNVKVGDTTVAADSITDTLTLEGNGINIATDANNDKITFSAVYSNSTPIVNGIGSIKPGDTFSEKPIQEILTMILYPYIPMDVATSATAKNSSNGVMSNNSTYQIPSYPTLDSITLKVTANSVENFSFQLYDSLSMATPIRTVRELQKIGEDTYIVFSNLDQQITVNKTFKIKYNFDSDLKDPDTGETIQNTGEITVGPFNLEFNPPSDPTVSVVGTTPSGTDLNASGTTTYKVGQSCTISSVTAEVASLNSAIGDDRTQGIESFTLTKSHDNTFSQDGSINDDKKSCTFSLTTADVLAPTYNNLTSGSVSYIYTVEGKYDSRTSESATWGDKNDSVNNSATVEFEFDTADIILESLSDRDTTISKLSPITITQRELYVKLHKNSDAIYSVELYKNNQAVAGQNIDLTGNSISATKDDNCTKTAYDTTGRIKYFSYATEEGQSICSTITFKAEADCKSGKLASNEITYTFEAPYCCGWVAADTNFDDVDVDTLKQLASTITLDTAFEDTEKGVKITKTNNTITTELSAPGSSKKFIFAIPTGNFTKAKNNNTNMDDFGQFENYEDIADTKKDIAFADKSTENYQILILANGTEGAINYTFS